MFLPYQQNHFLYSPYYLLERGEKRTENIIYVSITWIGQNNKTKKKSVSVDILEGF